ncbi:MAG: phage holin family protein [Gudongella oleilytica]|nr:phage holin family protein [Gudongella oleilytica]MDY0255904.1 phage holin family protein [Gudongella oleilytica]
MGSCRVHRGKGFTLWSWSFRFLLTAVILYLTRYIVDGFSISIMGALLGALVLGIVDLIIPGNRFK